MEFSMTELYEESKILETLKNNISFEGNLYFKFRDKNFTDRKYRYNTKSGKLHLTNERDFDTETIIDNSYKFDEFIQKEIIDKIPQRYNIYRDDKIRSLKQYKNAELELSKKEKELEEYKFQCENIKKENSKKESEIISNLNSFKYLCYVSSFTLISVIILKFML